MRILGLDNVFGDNANRYSEINTEALIDRDPDLIVLLTQGDQTLNPLDRPCATGPNSPACRPSGTTA
jgi:ABC-type Fe3+-hydroxamate transport system substrate-binding protein